MEYSTLILMMGLVVCTGIFCLWRQNATFGTNLENFLNTIFDAARERLMKNSKNTVLKNDPDFLTPKSEDDNPQKRLQEKAQDLLDQKFAIGCAIVMAVAILYSFSLA